MRIDTPAGLASLALQNLGKSNPADRQQAPSVLGSSAKTAVAPTILPAAVQSGGLSFETVLAIQREEHPVEAPRRSAATQAFLDEAQKTPAERMREEILDALGVTEEDLARMSPEERTAIEDKIRALIEEKIRQAMGADKAAPESDTAATLRALT